MTAHLDAVLSLPGLADEGTQGQGAALRESLVALHDAPPPAQTDEVPDLYFALQASLGDRHGAAVGLVRLGLSRNDLDMTVYKMHGRRLLLRLGEACARLRALLLDQAEANL